MVALIKIAVHFLADAAWFAVLLCGPNKSVQAENLFLRQQLALFKERSVQPRRIIVGTDCSLIEHEGTDQDSRDTNYCGAQAKYLAAFAGKLTKATLQRLDITKEFA